jgi:hypothetical protein
MFVEKKWKEIMSKNKFKSRGRVVLSDKETSSLKISKLGNPLEKLDKVIDFEMFREELEKELLNQNKRAIRDINHLM